MKNVKRLMSALLAFTLMIVPLVVNAQESESEGEYIRFTGEIQEVNIEENKGSIRVKNEEKEELIFHVTEEVFVTDMRLTKENKIMNLEKGAKVSVFYTKNTPVALSMPGQLTPDVIVVENGDKMVKVDKFDDSLLSSDGDLALIVDEKDIDKYKGKDLLVFYSITTESLPAQTSPDSIVILNEVESETPEIVEPEESEITPIRLDGTITNVNRDGDKLSIRVKSEKDEKVLHITEEVFVTDMTLTKENKILHLQEDAEIVAFYPKNTPITASMPGQLTPEVVVVKNGDKLVKFDYFDNDLISSDGKLKLDVQDEKAKEEYKDEKLLVFYKEATKSIPAITEPELVTIVKDRVVEEVEEIKLDRVRINGKDKPMKLYEKNDGTIMLPVRELSEALSYKVKWNGKKKPIEITKGSHWSSIELGKNSYIFARQTPFKLSHAPELVNGKTYVPYDFIKNVLRIEPNIVNGVIEIIE